MNKKTKIVSITHASNVLGTINPVEKIAKIVKEKSNAYFIVDGAQSVPHMPVDVKKMGCDFLDAGEVVKVDPKDGLHITRESQQELAELVAKRVKELV